jgi:hypothetical protein
MGIIGAVLSVVGGLAWLLTNSAATVCSSALVSALDPGQCNSYAGVHDIGLGGAVVGVVLIVVAIVRS